MGKTITVSNLKGGVGKTMTAASLAFGLARQGKSVLCLDADAQNSLTVSLGVAELDKLPTTLSTMMSKIINKSDFTATEGVIQHPDGIFLLPSNQTLAGMEIVLVQQYGRETILRQYISRVKPFYDYVVVDSPPSLDLMTVNALAAADSIVIPVTPKYLDLKGMELLLRTIEMLRGQINPELTIDGILLTMVDRRTNFTRDIIGMIEKLYGESIRIFKDYIPLSVRAAEASVTGRSIFEYDPRGKVAAAYDALAKGVMDIV
jgi:chromosome partitioning protein